MSDKEFGGIPLQHLSCKNRNANDGETGSDDLSLPKGEQCHFILVHQCADCLSSPATVQKIISEILPQLSHASGAASMSKDAAPKDFDMTFTRPARDLLISCSLEFLRMLSSESNDISERESKKTISVEHVEQALTDLGFGSYIEGCRSVVGEWQEVQKKRVGRGEKMRNFGGMDKMGEEELRRMQEALLGEARGRMEGHVAGGASGDGDGAPAPL